jgi:hypothetical protein
MNRNPDDILDAVASGNEWYCPSPLGVEEATPADAFLFGLPELTLINRTIALCVALNKHLKAGPDTLSLIKEALDAHNAVVQSLEGIIANVDLIQARLPSATPPDPFELRAAIERTSAPVQNLVLAISRVHFNAVGASPWNQSGPYDFARYAFDCFFSGLQNAWRDIPLKLETPPDQHWHIHRPTIGPEGSWGERAAIPSVRVIDPQSSADWASLRAWIAADAAIIRRRSAAISEILPPSI